jgi:hypothetical protein
VPTRQSAPEQGRGSRRADIVCSGAAMKGEGKAKGTFAGDTGFKLL